jgi:hypothetical protein
MEQLIIDENILPMAIGWKPLESLAIANNLLAFNIKAIDLRISPWATTIVA